MRSANGRNNTPGRDIEWYGLNVPGGQLLEFSGYTGAMGQQAPLEWFDWLCTGFSLLCDHDGSAFAISQERGDRRRLIHFQWILRLITTTAMIERLRRFIRNSINILPGSNLRCKIQVQQFNTQTWSYMLGYLQKDAGQLHYRFSKFGVTDHEAQQGKIEYDMVGLRRATMYMQI